MMDLRYQSWKSWKIVNIDLTQQFMFYRFSPIPVINWYLITWLLPVFVDWLALEYQQEEENKRYFKNSKTYIKI